MTFHLPDHPAYDLQSSTPEKTGIEGLISKYSNAIKMALGTTVLTASGLTAVHAYKDDIVSLRTQYAVQKQESFQSGMLRELSIGMIESRREGSQKGLIWAIEHLQKQEGYIARFKLSDTLDTARQLEKLIIDKTNPQGEGETKSFMNFSFPATITKESIQNETEFFEAVLALYKLRNPGNDDLTLDELVALQWVFVIDFAVDMVREGGQIKKLDRYYIRKITLAGPASN